MRGRTWFPFVACVSLAVLAVRASARADTVTLTSGRVIEDVETREEGDKIRVTKADGSSVLYPKTMIEKIDVKATSAQELRERREALEAGDVNGRVALAIWCEGRGLHHHARALYKEALALDPHCAEAIAGLARLEPTEAPTSQQDDADPSDAGKDIAVKLLEEWEGGRPGTACWKSGVEAVTMRVQAYEFVETFSHVDALRKVLDERESALRYELDRIKERAEEETADPGEQLKRVRELKAEAEQLERAKNGDAQALARIAPGPYVGFRVNLTYRMKDGPWFDRDWDLILQRQGSTWRVVEMLGVGTPERQDR